MQLPPDQHGSPTATGYFVAIDGKTYGPYTTPEVLQYLAEHKIVHRDLAWKEGMPGWVPLAEIFGDVVSAPPQQGDSSATSAPTSAKRQKPLSKLRKLTPETIRQTTKRGSLPLHRAAKNGTFNEISRELLTPSLFLIQNSDGETALHVAARKGTLHQVPPEFFTLEALSVVEQFGRTPLHMAAAYGTLSQLPPEVLTEQLLTIRRSGNNENTVVHEAAYHNHLDQIPQVLLTPAMLKLKNAARETPLETLEANRATSKQLAYLQGLGVNIQGARLTKHEASELIDAALAGERPTIQPTRVQPQAPPIIVEQPQARPFTTVPLTQGTAEWLAWRCAGVGASDAPTIMGENPWKTTADLLWEKRHPSHQISPNEAEALGTALEPEARSAFIQHTGKQVFPACLQSTEYAWLRASLDGLASTFDSVVEIKCGKSTYRITAESGRPPDYYYGQLQHTLAVTGLPVIDFWCYLPGLSPLLIPVPRDEQYIKRLLWAEFEFWGQVLAGG